ncbi:MULTISPECIES: helix-turn-helix transcriptional regulator [Paenibacillus]|uniref:helix-turn-helix transcriptional regulator n=1 Tax=Paenibacillus TaxID=44249 RepID=UPI0011EB0E91|nr:MULTISPECIES: helix-turn-helix transcriptional regulator [Paenibacillus]MBE0336952.1 XRE family transcriptional regulator [Paenibacillus sp. 23TSA30-6]
MSSENSKSKTMGAFLKSRRNRLQPEQAGIRRSQGQRRTPGLRREEVAMLAGVSATYYTWLEQGREVTASKEIIESIGKALQLTDDESAHLIQLWNPNETVAISSIQTTLNPQWQNIIEQLSYPSFISNDRAEVLAWNSAANEVIIDFSSMPVSERVMIRLLFVDPGLRRRMINWEEFASYSVAVYRTYYDKYRGDPWFEETVEQLRVESTEFDTMWKLHNIQLKKVNRVSFQIPGAVDVVSYDINSLASIADHPDMHMCIYTPILEGKASFK